MHKAFFGIPRRYLFLDEVSVTVSMAPIPDRWAMFWSVLWAVHLRASKETP